MRGRRGRWFVVAVGLSLSACGDDGTDDAVTIADASLSGVSFEVHRDPG